MTDTNMGRSTHFIETCQFGKVHRQCRCPGVRIRRSIYCTTPEVCRNASQETSETLTFDRPTSVDNPSHYRVGTSGVECIEIIRHLSFNLGNSIKYLWRLGNKDEDANELKKAIWYLVDEIEMGPQDRQHPEQLFNWSKRFATHILSLEGSPRVSTALDRLREGVESLGDLNRYRGALSALEDEAKFRGIRDYRKITK